MNLEVISKLYEKYADEIYTSTFTNSGVAEVLLKTLILYKEYANIEGYLYMDEPLSFVLNPPQGFEKVNTIAVGGILCLDEDKKDELTTAFINRNIEDDSEKINIYIDEDKRIVHIVGNDDRVFNDYTFRSAIERIFCALITKLMPWYFGNMPDEIIEECAPLFIGYDKFDIFEKKFEQFVKESGIEEQMIYDKLSEMGKRLVEQKIQERQNSIERCEREITSYLRSIAEHNALLKRLKAEIAMANIEADEYQVPVDEVIDYLKTTTDDISIHAIEHRTVVFKIVTTFEYYDEYDSCVLTNPGTSYLFNDQYAMQQYSVEQLKEFYKLIMEDQTLKVYGTTYVSLDMVSGHPVARTDLPADKNTIRHPHLMRHNCFGNATSAIAEFVSQNRYVEALNQIFYAAKQISLPDSAANIRFVESLVNTKCILCEDGEFRDFEEVMQYLGKEKEGN